MPDFPVQVPEAFETVRHRCPHCRKTFAQKGYAEKHVVGCRRNPLSRNCQTCTYLSPPCCDGPNESCGCNGDPTCTKGGDMEVHYEVRGCSLWQKANYVTTDPGDTPTPAPNDCAFDPKPNLQEVF